MLDQNICLSGNVLNNLLNETLQVCIKLINIIIINIDNNVSNGFKYKTKYKRNNPFIIIVFGRQPSYSKYNVSRRPSGIEYLKNLVVFKSTNNSILLSFKFSIAHYIYKYIPN